MLPVYRKTSLITKCLKVTVLVTLIFMLGACSGTTLRTTRSVQISLDRASQAISVADQQAENSAGLQAIRYTERARSFLEKAESALGKTELSRAEQFAKLAESEARVAIEASKAHHDNNYSENRNALKVRRDQFTGKPQSQHREQ